jgi:hypothetical protein
MENQRVITVQRAKDERVLSLQKGFSDELLAHGEFGRERTILDAGDTQVPHAGKVGDPVKMAGNASGALIESVQVFQAAGCVSRCE